MYTTNTTLQESIEQAVHTIQEGRPEGLEAMIKKTPTLILKADESHKTMRYRPGSKLITYTGIDENGQLIKETWGGGEATLDESSVVLKNVEPIKYPEGHTLAGKEVRGRYDRNGEFHIDEEGEVLYNEYVSNMDFVRGAYGIEPNIAWKSGYKLDPSYVFEIPKFIGDVTITTASGIDIRLTGGDYVIIDTKKGKVKSVHGCEKNWLKKTYMGLEEYESGI